MVERPFERRAFLFMCWLQSLIHVLSFIRMFPEHGEPGSRNLQIGLQTICFMAKKIGLDVSFPSCVIRSLNVEVH